MKLSARRRLTKLAMVVAACTITLSACGLTTPPGKSGSSNGGAEVIVGYGDIDTLDPTQFKTNTATLVVGNVYGTLFAQKFQAKDGVLVGTAEYAPSLAESANYSADGKLLTITLKPGLKFADGSPLTAADVVYTLQRSLSDVGYTGIFASYLRFTNGASGVRAASDTTVEIQTSGVSPLLRKFLSFQTFGILSKAAAEKGSTKKWATDYFAKGGVSSGPYKIEARSEGSSITLVKNPEYTVANLADAPAKVTIQNQPNAEQAYLALKSGSIDIDLSVSPDLAAQAADNRDLKVYKAATGDLVYLGMNQTTPALKDVRVRQAISHLVPYRALREKVMAGFAGPAYGPDPYPMNGTLDGSGTKQAYDTDPAAAAALLRQAGVSGLSLKMTVQASDVTAVKSATFVQSALGEGGITVKVDKLSDADYQSAVGDGTTQLFIGSWHSWGEDPIYQLNFLLRTGQYTNYARYSSKQVDGLLDAAMKLSGDDERYALGKQAQQIAIDEAPWAFMFTRDMITLTRQNVGGLTKPDDLFPRFQYLTLN